MASKLDPINARERALEKFLPKEEAAETIDKSLRAQAMQRATEGKVPRTLTPWEWEEWYAEQGMPENFKKAEKTEPQSAISRLWQRYFSQRQKTHVQSNCARHADEDAEF